MVWSVSLRKKRKNTRSKNTRPWCLILAIVISVGCCSAVFGTGKTHSIRYSTGTCEQRFDLMDNVYMSHLIYKGGLVLDGASPEFIKYIVHGEGESPWGISCRVPGEFAGSQLTYINTDSATLRLPLQLIQTNHAPTITILFESPIAQRLNVYVNGQLLKKRNIKVYPEFQELAIPFLATMTNLGETEIELRFRRESGQHLPGRVRAAIRYIAVGNKRMSDVPLLNIETHNILLPDEAELVYWVYLGSNAKVVIVDPVTPWSDLSCKLRVRVASSTVPYHVLLDEMIETGSGHNPAFRTPPWKSGQTTMDIHQRDKTEQLARVNISSNCNETIQFSGWLSFASGSYPKLKVIPQLTDPSQRKIVAGQYTFVQDGSQFVSDASDTTLDADRWLLNADTVLHYNPEVWEDSRKSNLLNINQSTRYRMRATPSKKALCPSQDS